MKYKIGQRFYVAGLFQPIKGVVITEKQRWHGGTLYCVEIWEIGETLNDVPKECTIMFITEKDIDQKLNKTWFTNYDDCFDWSTKIMDETRKELNKKYGYDQYGI